MLIVCPTCATSYNLSAENLGTSGRTVRCVRCANVWHAEVPRETKLLAAVGALPQELGQGGPLAEAKGFEGTPPLGEASAGAPLADDEWSDDSFAAGSGDGMQQREGAHDSVSQHQLFDVEAPPTAPVDLDESRPFRRADEARGADDTPAQNAGIEDAQVEHFGAEDGHIEDSDGEGAAAIVDIETLAAHRRHGQKRRRALRWPLSALQTAIMAFIMFDATLVGWRSDVVRLLPQTASFYAILGMPVNLRGLAFEGIATSSEQHEGVPVLVVEGNVVNIAGKPMEVPRLKFSVRNGSGGEIYSWTMAPPRTVLPSGETLAFRSRLASPPPEGRDVLVRFFARRDLAAGVR